MSRPGAARARHCSCASTGRAASVCRPSRPARPAIRADGRALGTGQAAGGEHLREDGVDLLADRRRVDGHAGQPRLDVVGDEELLDERPHLLEAVLGARVGVVGAVAEADRPAGGVVAVVRELLDALRGHRGEHGDRPSRQPLEQGEAPRREQQQPRDQRARSRAAGRDVGLGQVDVAERALVAEVGQGVLVGEVRRRVPRPVRAAAQVPGAGEQQAGLAEQVERDVGQRDLLLQLGRVGGPTRRGAGRQTSASSPSMRQ